MKVRVSAEWVEQRYDELEVDIGDGLTRDQAEDKIHVALKAAGMHSDGGDTDWDHLNDMPKYEPDPCGFPEPPDDAWFEFRGRKWATTGAILIRDDGPRPLAVPSAHPWVVGR